MHFRVRREIFAACVRNPWNKHSWYEKKQPPPSVLMAKKGQKRAAAAVVTVAANGDDMVEWAKDQVGAKKPTPRRGAKAAAAVAAAAEEVRIVVEEEVAGQNLGVDQARDIEGEAREIEHAAREIEHEAREIEHEAKEVAAQNLLFDQARENEARIAAAAKAAVDGAPRFGGAAAADMAAKLAADMAAAAQMEEVRAQCKHALDEITAHRNAALEEVERQKVEALAEIAPLRRSGGGGSGFVAPFSPPPPAAAPADVLAAYDAVNNALSTAIVALTEAQLLVQSTTMRLGAQSVTSITAAAARPAWLAAQHEDDFVADNFVPAKKVQRVVDVTMAAAATVAAATKVVETPAALPLKKAAAATKREQAGIMHGEDFERDARGMY